MSMNHLRKKAALKKFANLTDGKTPDEVEAALKADTMKLTDDEVIEILDALYDATGKEGKEEESNKPGPDENSGINGGAAQPPSAAKPADRSGSLKPYTRYKVVPKYKAMVINAKKENVLLGYERTGDALQITYLEARHAEALNKQTPNSLNYYFAEGEATFIDAEKFFE